MTTIAITGNDTLTLFDRVFNDLADGNVSELTYPNEKIQAKTGKNGNSIYSRNAQGNVADLTLRVVRGSSDDRFLLGKLNAQDADLPTSELATGQLIKKIGDGTGTVVNDTHDLRGGVFSRNVNVADNVEGDTEVAVAVYNLRFTNARRTIG